MIKIIVETNQGVIANSLLEHSSGTLMYSQADWHRIELSVLHGVELLDVPNLLRLMADDLERSQQQNESFQEWQQSASATMQNENESLN